MKIKETTYRIDEIEVQISGNSKPGWFASFNYTGDDHRKAMDVLLHEANLRSSFKTMKEIKTIADQMSTQL